MICPRCRDKGWFNAPTHTGLLTPTNCTCRRRPNHTTVGFIWLALMAAGISLLAMWWPK